MQRPVARASLGTLNILLTPLLRILALSQLWKWYFNVYIYRTNCIYWYSRIEVSFPIHRVLSVVTKSSHWRYLPLLHILKRTLTVTSLGYLLAHRLQFRAVPLSASLSRSIMGRNHLGSILDVRKTHLFLTISKSIFFCGVG
jgi:hypothetical protein